MLGSFPFALAVGTVLGFLAGLGVGGGSLLILWLTLVLGMSAEAARGINLLFFLPAAILSSLLRLGKALRIRPLLPAMAAGVLCAWGASLLSTRMELNLLRRLFGGLLLLTALRELTWKPKA